MSPSAARALTETSRSSETGGTRIRKPLGNKGARKSLNLEERASRQTSRARTTAYQLLCFRHHLLDK
ncbi:hypothetical protein [Chamaesiphon polymorphus]|uniref:hypothetical protein n=1 Tax=Chamaesiphon polymorphus TaxID=2107691 RepID=UPI0011B2481D|nr:hypothetical protein [Chamaesiphon polymorphus]